jgi:Molecular chaperone
MSSDDEARFTYPIPGAKLEKLLIRSVFENLIAETISTMDEAAHRCLSDAGVKPSDITDIIMVGGSTFVPTVETLFLKQFPNAKLTDNDRFGAVAKGLARHVSA